MSTSTTPPDAFQITVEAAEAYESAFVPALFAQWAPPLCAAAGITRGSRVLDVACGTGIVARTAADIAGPGAVTGLDLNEAMLTVARRVRPDCTWLQGDVAAMPLPDAAFDVVVCQMAMMFFPDRGGALREMARVAAPGGTVAVLVPSQLDAQPAYGPFVDMAARHAGTQALALLSTYFSCGVAELRSLCSAAGLSVTAAGPRAGTVTFPSVDAMVATEVESTPLREHLDEPTYRQIRAGARETLAPFTGADGSVTAPFECQVVAARRHPSA